MAGVYIHVPFCHSKCAYCDFHSVINQTKAEAYIDALALEWKLRRHEISQDISTIYIGGGTPTSLPPRLLDRLLRTVPYSGEGEFTIETNPEDVTLDLCLRLVDNGVNRISMGVQSFNDDELALLGRRHDAAKALDAIDTFVGAGIDNYSIDLIYGLPEQSLDDFKASVHRLMLLHPPHFSAYILSYEPHTKLTAMRKSGKIKPLADDIITDMYLYLCNVARNQGYNHYEISNFALPGKEAVHNSNYWNGTPYLGLGPAAHSYDGLTRRINPTLGEYLQATGNGNTAFIIDDENDNSRFNDLLITALRTSKGLDLKTLAPIRRNQLMADARQYIDHGLLVTDGARLFIPEVSWLVSDAIMADLMQV